MVKSESILIWSSVVRYADWQVSCASLVDLIYACRRGLAVWRGSCKRRLGYMVRRRGICGNTSDERAKMERDQGVRWDPETRRCSLDIPLVSGREQREDRRRRNRGRCRGGMLLEKSTTTRQGADHQSTSPEKSPSSSPADRQERRLSSSSSETREPRSDPTPTPSLPVSSGEFSSATLPSNRS